MSSVDQKQEVLQKVQPINQLFQDEVAPSKDKVTDISAIQPTLSNQMEEEKSAFQFEDGANQTNMRDDGVNLKALKAIREAKLNNPDTTIILSTSLNMEIDIEQSFKPLQPGFTTRHLKDLIRRAHSLDEDQDFHLCGKQSRLLIDFADDTEPASLIDFDEEHYILALLNERCAPNQDILSLKQGVTSQRPSGGGKEQPTNLERSIKLDPCLSVAQKESAIKDLLKKNFPDIVKDKIGGSKYKCFSNKCRKTFHHLKQLFEHQKIHLLNYRPFACESPGCTKSFMSKGHLRNHAETHQSQKNFRCPVQGCNESYSRQQRLKVHLKKHNGNRDYVCPFENCRKAFYEKGNLKTHLRLHTGEKPYHCIAKGCEKSFATQGHLNDHFLKTHQLNGIHQTTQGEGANITSPKLFSHLQSLNKQMTYVNPSEVGFKYGIVDKINHMGDASIPKHDKIMLSSKMSADMIKLYSQSSILAPTKSKGQQMMSMKTSNDGPDHQAMLIYKLQQQQRQQQLLIQHENNNQQQMLQILQQKQQQQQNFFTAALNRANTMENPPIKKSEAMIEAEMFMEAEKQMGFPGAANKRKKILKINITAANNVIDESNFYNKQVNSDPKLEVENQIASSSAPETQQCQNNSTSNYEDKDKKQQNQQEDLENISLDASADKKGFASDIDNIDIKPNFFSFKDYEKQIGQTRGAQTCLKAENRTLAPPTPMKANPEMNLDSKSQSQQSRQQSSQHIGSQSNQTLRQAFGIKPQNKTDEFVPLPAKTPLNRSQLAKRRFFNYAQPQPIVDQSDGNNNSAADENSKRKRDVKIDEKMEQSFNLAIRGLPKVQYHSMSQKSVEENASNQTGLLQQAQINSIVSSGPTFAPQNKGSHYTMGGLNKTPSMSQTSHGPNIQVLVNNRNTGQEKFIKSQSHEKSEQINSKLKDFKVFQNDIKASQSNCPRIMTNQVGGKECSAGAKNTLPNSAVDQSNQAARSKSLPKFPYEQMTQTAAKQSTTHQAFFQTANQGMQDEAIKIQSCQKIPVRNEVAFFNTLMHDQSSKLTPQLSQNSVANTLQAFDQQTQKLHMLSNLSSQGGNPKLQQQLAPLQQMQSQEPQQFNFQQQMANMQNQGVLAQMPQQLTSPMVSSNSNNINISQQAIIANNHNQAVQKNNVNTLNNINAAVGGSITQMMALPNNHQSSSGSKGILQTQKNQNLLGSLTDRSPSSLRWDRSQFSVSPISQNLSNPSVFFNHPIKGQQNLNGNTMQQQQQVAAQQQQLQLKQTIQMLSKQHGNNPGQQVAHPQAGSSPSIPSIQVSNPVTQRGVQTNLTLNHHLDLVLVQVDAQQLTQSVANQQPQQQRCDTITSRDLGNSNRDTINSKAHLMLRNENSSSHVQTNQEENAQIYHIQDNVCKNAAGAADISSQQKQKQSNKQPKVAMLSQQVSPPPQDTAKVKATCDNAQPATTKVQSDMKGVVAASEAQDEELKMSRSPNTDPNSRKHKMSLATQGLLTSQFRKEKDGNSSGNSVAKNMQSIQMDLMKKKSRYQQKLQKIDYKMQVHNHLIQQALMKQNQNLFFTEPVVPPQPEHQSQIFKMGNAQQQAVPNPALAYQNFMNQNGNSWMNQWQHQQYMIQQQVATANMEKQSRLQQQIQQFNSMVSPADITCFQMMQQQQQQHVDSTMQNMMNFFGQGQAQMHGAQHAQQLKNHQFAPFSAMNPPPSPLSMAFNSGSAEALNHQISPSPQIQQFFSENQLMQQMQQQQNTRSAQPNYKMQYNPSRQQMDQNNFLMGSLSSSSSGPGSLPQNIFKQAASGGNSTAGFNNGQATSTMPAQYANFSNNSPYKKNAQKNVSNASSGLQDQKTLLDKNQQNQNGQTKGPSGNPETME